MFELKDIAGIGRLKIRFKNPSKRKISIIPTLHYIVFKTDDGYDSLCLELIQSSFGEREEDAIKGLAEVSGFLLNELLKSEKDGEKQLLDLVSSGDVEEYWKMYRRVNFELGLNGISTDMTEKLLNRIEKLKKDIASLEKIKDILLFKKNNIDKSNDIEVIKEDYERYGQAS